MMLRTGSDGFTFVELMFTVIILSVGLIGVLRAYTVSLDAMDAAQSYIGEVSLAKEKMAEAGIFEIGNVDLRQYESAGKFQDGNKSFDWKREVFSGSNNLSLVKVTVLNERSYPAREFILESYAQN